MPNTPHAWAKFRTSGKVERMHSVSGQLSVENRGIDPLNLAHDLRRKAPLQLNIPRRMVPNVIQIIRIGAATRDSLSTLFRRAGSRHKEHEPHEFPDFTLPLT